MASPWACGSIGPATQRNARPDLFIGDKDTDI
jgi:hypothetical protein